MIQIAFKSNHRKRMNLKKLALGSTALSVLLMASSAALAAAPATGSLPGGFSTNVPDTTYTSSSSTSGTISIGAVNDGDSAKVLQFGGTALTNSVSAPTGITTNTGFSIGSGASLSLTDSEDSLPTIVNDETGSPSQIYGSLNASGLSGGLFVANANGVVVGSTGVITGPAAGVGLVGYGIDSATSISNGDVTVGSTSTGTGDITVSAGADISGPLLIAGNGAINVGAVGSDGDDTSILAGYGFTASNAGLGYFDLGDPLAGSEAVVNLTGGSPTAPLTPEAIFAAGNVTNSGDTTLSPTFTLINGTFSNTGIANVDDLFVGSIDNEAGGTLNDSGGTLATSITSGASSGADIINAGTINESSGDGLNVIAGSYAKGYASGNFINTGLIDFLNPADGDEYIDPAYGSYNRNAITVNAANIYFGGSVEQATVDPATYSVVTTTPLSNANALGGFELYAGYDNTSSGVVDIASTVYSTSSYNCYSDTYNELVGQAVRVISGGLYDPVIGDETDVYIGAGNATDPFQTAVSAPGATLAYNLSLFPGSEIESSYVDVEGSGIGSNVNLDGVLSSQVANTSNLGFGYYRENEIDVDNVDNINGHASGGFAVNNGGYIYADFLGNINNPYGASEAGSTAFQYNYIPVNVGTDASTGGQGTAFIELDGASAFSGTPQLVNLLVNGNAVLIGEDGDYDAPGYTDGQPVITPSGYDAPEVITPEPSYTNNHLVVQATGNIGLIADEGDTFYWPGLVYLSTIGSAENPTGLGSGSITLGYNAGNDSNQTNLNNVLPADVSGNAGIFLETNNLDLDGATVTTNTNSWVNFSTPQLANSFYTVSPTAFYDATYSASSDQLSVQQLPESDYQPASE